MIINYVPQRDIIKQSMESLIRRFKLYTEGRFYLYSSRSAVESGVLLVGEMEPIVLIVVK